MQESFVFVYVFAFVFVFVFGELVFVPPLPFSPFLSHRFLLFSDGWWCIAGVSQAESLLQTEPNLTFTAGATLPTTPESLPTHSPYIHFALPQTGT